MLQLRWHFMKIRQETSFTVKPFIRKNNLSHLHPTKEFLQQQQYQPCSIESAQSIPTSDLLLVSGSCQANAASHHRCPSSPRVQVQAARIKHDQRDTPHTSLVSIKHARCSGLSHSNDRCPNRKFHLCCLHNTLDFKNQTNEHSTEPNYVFKFSCKLKQVLVRGSAVWA